MGACVAHIENTQPLRKKHHAVPGASAVQADPSLTVFVSRPFEAEWPIMSAMEAERVKGAFNKSNWEMLKAYIEKMTEVTFMREAHKHFGIVEMARFY